MPFQPMKRPPFGRIRCDRIGKNDVGFGAWNAVGQVFANAARYFGVSFLFIGCVFFGNKFFLAFYGRATRNAGQTNLFGRFIGFAGIVSPLSFCRRRGFDEKRRRLKKRRVGRYFFFEKICLTILLRGRFVCSK